MNSTVLMNSSRATDTKLSPLLPITVMPGTSHMHESFHEKGD
jgi:hypothetical protein